MGGEPSGALIVFAAFSAVGAALTGMMLMLLGIERRKLLSSLRRGVDLFAQERSLLRALAIVGDRPTPHRHTIELKLLCAIVAMERADLAAAEAHLVNAHDQSAARALYTRISVLRGTFDSYNVPTASEQLGKLGELIDIDTAAQIELASQRVPASIRLLMPTTRARVLAAQQQSDACLAILRALAPSRVDAMCTLHPNDPATRLWLRRSDGPYR